MSGDTRHTLRRSLLAMVIVAGSAGLVLGTAPAPATAKPLTAIGAYTPPTTEQFPADALGGERNALAANSLLMYDPATGAEFRRTENKDGTALVADPASPDAPLPQAPGRPRINPAAVTAAIGSTAQGSTSSPFMQRTLSLSLTGPGSSQTGSILQLTSPSDITETGSAYTSLGAPTDTPTPGRTYTIVATASGASAPPLLTATPGEKTNPVLLYSQTAGQPELAQQWTAVPVSGGKLLLVSRADGTCLGHGGATEALCSTTNTELQWDVEPLPQGAGTGNGLYNAYDHEWLGYHAASSGDGWGYPTGWNTSASPTPPADTHFAFQWRAVTQTTAIPASVAFSVENRADMPFALATGDLDGVKGEEGAPRDEAVVAYGSGGDLAVSVVDYAAGKNNVPAVTTKKTSIPLLTDAASGSKYVSITASAVDIEGNGVDDIVITYEDASGGVHVAAARYSHDSAGHGVISPIGASQSLDSALRASLVQLKHGTTYDVYSTAAAVGDFDGDGSQELAWAGASADNDADPWLVTATLHVSGDTFSVHADTTGGVGAQPTASAPGFNAFIQVASGQFQPATADTGTRQIAVTWALDGGDQPGGVWLNVLTVHEGQSARTALYPNDPKALHWSPGATSLSLAVGGFNNDLSGTSTTTNWGIAVSEPGPAVWNATSNIVTLIQPQANGVPPAYTEVPITPTTASSLAVSGYELTSWDPLGDSLLLGTPIVFTLQQYANASLVGAEPPTHSDWLGGKFVNISRNSDFNLALGSTTTGAYSNTSSNTVNQAYGLSLSADISATVSGGVPILDKASGTVALSGAFNANFASLTSHESSSNTTHTTSITQTTQDDDIVDATVQNIAVYRYPVLATQAWDQTDAATNNGCSGGCYGFWDVVVPGTPTHVSAGARDVSFFQPSWQPGNVLSYPALVNGTFTPPDVGPYSYTDTDGHAQTSDTPLANAEFTVGGNATTAKLDTSTADSAGSAEKSTLSWNANGSIKASYSAEVKIPGVADLSSTGSFMAGLNAAQEFTGTNTGTTSNSHGKSFSVNIPAIAENRGYNVAGSYYYDTSGAPTVGWGVTVNDATTNREAADWWTKTYGEIPDPALNLPDASVLDYDPSSNHLNTVKWNPDASSQLIRGFSVTMPDGGDPVTSGAAYGAAPQSGAGAAASGDPLVFKVDVANYSLKKMPAPSTVDFYAVRVDKNFVGVVPNSSPVPIGTATLPALGPQQHITVSSPTWAAQGGADGSAQNWRIFVVLNHHDGTTPNAEIHGLNATAHQGVCPASSVQNDRPLIDPMTGKTSTLQCGQNDQGYGELSVFPAPAHGAQPGPANARLIGGGVVTGKASTLNLTAKSAIPAVGVHDPTTVLVRATADHTSRGQQTVIVYEGLPKNGKVVAVTQMHGVLTDGTSTASFSYTPQTVGVHDLYAVILGTATAGPSHGIIVRVDAAVNGSGGKGSGGNGGVTPPGGHSHGAGATGGHGATGAHGATSGNGTTLGSNQASAGQSGILALTGQNPWVWGTAGLLGLALISTGVLIRRLRPRRH